MAISFAELDTNTALGATSIATSASISPSTNFLVKAYVLQVIDGAGTPDEPTGSGNSLTWVVEDTVTWTDGATFNARLTSFRALGTPSAGSATFSLTTSCDEVALWVGQSGDVDTSGTNGSGANIQSVTGESAGTAATVTLAAFGDATNNATLFCVAWAGTAANSTPEAGFTGFTEVDVNVSYGLRVQWRLNQDTSPAATLSASTEWGAIGEEIKAAAGGGGRTTKNTRAFPLGMAVGMNWVMPGQCS